MHKYRHPASETLHFLDLSKELRLTIYEYLPKALMHTDISTTPTRQCACHVIGSLLPTDPIMVGEVCGPPSSGRCRVPAAVSR